MSVRALALNWSLDGPVGAVFLVLVIAAGAVYLAAAAHGRRIDRRRRRWPRTRTACFLAGLAVLVLDIYSGIGGEADARLSVHMVEHMVMWVVVAPLLVAGAPVRLSLYSMPRGGRLRLAALLHSQAVVALTGPVGSVGLFGGVLLLTHVPAVYGLARSDPYVHAAEHALYLVTAMLVWAPLLGVDPLPHRPGPRGQLACMAACMIPMALIAAWLAAASHPVYRQYLNSLGPAAMHDQRVAAAIMFAAGLPAFAMPRSLRPAKARRETMPRLARATAD